MAYDGEVIRPNIILCYKFRFETMRICFPRPVGIKEVLYVEVTQVACWAS